MNQYVVTENLEAVIAQKVRIPTTVMWNRLEGRPRRPDFTRALKAEVRDPLWLITRQWQMGEFAGEDAGSPVGAKAAWTTDSFALDRNIPLDALAEARPIELERAKRLHNADLRLAMGRQWRRMLAVDHAVRVPDFLNQYHFDAPDPANKADFPITAHAAAWQTLAAVAGRAIDGGALLLHLQKPGGRASDNLGLVDPEKQQIDDLGDQFRVWAERLYFQPTTPDAWQPRHLEYELKVSAPDRDVPAALAMPEHRGGRVDWFSFDAVPPSAADTGGTKNPPTVLSFMPTTIHFDGMPNTRYWAFEEGAVNFGDIDPDTTDLSKLLLIDFGLLFANDWFVLPIELPVGSLTRIQGLAVTNTFGERFWIEPAVDRATDSSSWQMFRLTPQGVADERLVIAPASFVGQESQPVESVACVRDEVSNMVWGIETVVQLPDGSSRRGRELALEVHAKFQSAVIAGAHTPPVNDAKISYTLMRSVAENWIPFIPVHVENDNRQIQLQRAAMPRLLEGEQGVTPAKITPRTRIMREGLDATPAVTYFLAEEEVERAGTVVETRWQRTRWWQGRVVLWQGHYRTCGRGEVASSLAFDILTPKLPASTA